MEVDGNQEIINEICNYCEEHQIKELLGEYLKRVVINKPSDPVKYLIQQVQEKPYVPKPKEDGNN